MIKKYNLSLIPLSKKNEIITLARKFSNLADTYLLGEQSFPHVTLYQFQSEETKIGYIWECIRNTWKENSIFLTFDKFSCITFDNNIFWVSLLPNNCDFLHNMHSFIANLLQLPTKKAFDPHMTLINTKNEKYEEEVIKFSSLYKPITDTFILSLGESDNVGQLIKVINRFDIIITLPAPPEDILSCDR